MEIRFYYNAIKHWNSLPNGVKEIENYAHFERKLKEYLILDSQRREVNARGVDLYPWLGGGGGGDRCQNIFGNGSKQPKW